MCVCARNIEVFDNIIKIICNIVYVKILTERIIISA